MAMNLSQFVHGLSAALAPLSKAPGPPAPGMEGQSIETEAPANVSQVILESAKSLSKLGADIGPDGVLPPGGTEVCQAVANALLQLCGSAVPADTAAPTLSTSVTAQAPSCAKSVQPGETMVKVAFTPAAFVAWANANIAVAAKEPREEALKRLACVARVVEVAKASNFEAAPSAPIKVEVEEAYLGSSGGEGAKLDLTVFADQKTAESAPVEAPSGDGGFAENQIAVLGNTVAALTAQANATQAQGSTTFAKRLLDSYPWPRDLASPDSKEERW